jgi:hypothetical protein
MKRKASFPFVFHSLIRTFDLAVEDTSVRKSEKKKTCFLFAFHSLIRTFDNVEGTATWK